MDLEGTPTPAVWYARVFGIVLTLVGVLGMFTTTSQAHAQPLLGFDVNLTHNIVHLATGALGLVAGFALLSLARTYALVLGIVYLVVAIWGFADADPLGLFVHINPADNVLHVAIGVIGLVAATTTRTRNALAG